MSRHKSRRPGQRTATNNQAPAPTVPLISWSTVFDLSSPQCPVEPSAWMRGVHAGIAARPEVQELLARRVQVFAAVGWPSTVTDAEGRTCDRCRTYVATGLHLFAYCATEPLGLTIIGGLCANCARREVVTL